MTTFYILALIVFVLSIVDTIFANKIKAIDSKKVEERTEEDNKNKTTYNIVRGISITGIFVFIAYAVFFVL